jgi:hypothetical protein
MLAEETLLIYFEDFMPNSGFGFEYSIAYGVSISLIFLLYVLYSKALLGHIFPWFGKLFDFKKLYFFALVIIFAVSGYFFGPLKPFGVLLISITFPTIVIFVLYLYSSSHSETPTLSVLSLVILWVLHALPLYFMLLLAVKFFYVLML